MAISFKKLKNDKNNRNIRSVVMNGSSHVNIFEPSVDDITFILDAQEEWVTREGYNISGEDLIRKIYPRFTDITDLEDLSDEEIRDVIENPTIALMSIKTEIESILNEIYKMITIMSRKSIQESDFEMEMLLLNKESIDRTHAMANKYSNDLGLPDRILEAQKAVEEVYSEQDNEALKNAIEKTNQISGKKVDIEDAKQQDILDFAQAIKAKQEELENDVKELVEEGSKEEKVDTVNEMDAESQYIDSMNKYKDIFSDKNNKQTE